MLTQFEDIRAWKYSRELTKQIYLLTRKPSFAKDYGLKDQLQRASVSIMLNIAEGFSSGSPKSFITFLRYSFRSTSEVKSVMYIALDLEYISQQQFEEITKELQIIQKCLSGLINHLKNKIKVDS